MSPFILVLLLAGGAYLLYTGWRTWTGRALNPDRATYWRGRRIELPSERRRGLPPVRHIGPALPYLIAGGVLVLVSLAALIG